MALMPGADDTINWYQENKSGGPGGEDNEIHLGWIGGDYGNFKRQLEIKT